MSIDLSSKYQIKDPSGSPQEIDVSLETYREAYAQQLTLPQLLSRKFPTDPSAYGTVFEQCMASAGVFLRGDNATGIKPPTISQLLSGRGQGMMGPIVAPDGSGALDPAGRLLYPTVILELLNLQLSQDDQSYESTFNQMIGQQVNITSDLYQQPSVDVTGPRASRMQPVAQGAEPANMIKISLANKAYTIPTFSIGLEITDQAMAKLAIDEVGIMVSEQASAQRTAWINEGIAAMVSGDTDRNLTALPSITAISLDPAAATGVTRKAWLKFLWSNWNNLSIDWVLGNDIDPYLILEDRAGRPTVLTDQGTDIRLDTQPVMAGPQMPRAVRYFPLSGVVLPANTIVGIDSRKAIRKVTYVNATYSAIEQYLIRRTQVMRIDIAELYTRFIDHAWKQMTYS
jgi:hypothetical protein